ncbi:hypothetical protein BIW11_12044 [Tropilaelaps mercedesae]|uniref:Uncharacterized protein n=1 Tax=Tropilaelaps mercedesae TaxID=418985 RepID=A0A1V9X8Z8_9ACAR|nr:hypothetical protein BIW11_12044 [Tropilaelaps mercedesae]
MVTRPHPNSPNEACGSFQCGADPPDAGAPTRIEHPHELALQCRRSEVRLADAPDPGEGCGGHGVFHGNAACHDSLGRAHFTGMRCTPYTRGAFCSHTVASVVVFACHHSVTPKDRLVKKEREKKECVLRAGGKRGERFLRQLGGGPEGVKREKEPKMRAKAKLFRKRVTLFSK